MNGTLPQNLGEVEMPRRLLAGGARRIADVGKFFGWKGETCNPPEDYTIAMLLANGWTVQRLSELAEGFEHVARITPGNSSAAPRAVQLREIVRLWEANELT